MRTCRPQRNLFICVIVVVIVVVASVASYVMTTEEPHNFLSVPSLGIGDYIIYSVEPRNHESLSLHFNVSEATIKDGFGLTKESISVATNVSNSMGDHWSNVLYVDLRTREPIVRHRIGLREFVEGGTHFHPDVWRYGVHGHLEPGIVLSPHYLPVLLQGSNLIEGKAVKKSVLGIEIKMMSESGPHVQSENLRVVVQVKAANFQCFRIQLLMTSDSPWPASLVVEEEYPGCYRERDRDAVIGLRYNMVDYNPGNQELRWAGQGNDEDNVPSRGDFDEWDVSGLGGGDSLMCPTPSVVVENLETNGTLRTFLDEHPTGYVNAFEYKPVISGGSHVGTEWLLQYADETLASMNLMTSWVIAPRANLSSPCVLESWRFESVTERVSEYTVLPKSYVPPKLLTLESAERIGETYLDIGISTRFAFTSDPWLDGYFDGHVQASDLLYFFDSTGADPDVLLSVVNGQTYLWGDVRI